MKITGIMSNKYIKVFGIIAICMCLMVSGTIVANTVVRAETNENVDADGKPVPPNPANMVYNESLDCYIETIKKIISEYDAKTNSNVYSQVTTSKYYSIDKNGEYICFFEDTVKEKLYSTPLPTVSPNPLQPDVIPSLSPDVTPIPTEEPYVESMDTTPIILYTSRESGKKAKLTWDTVLNANGYIIYRSTKEDSGFKQVKVIDDASVNKCTFNNLKKKKTYYYRIVAFQNVGDKTNFTELSESEQVSVFTTQKIKNKLKSLKEKYPNGYYWNHVGCRVSKTQNVSGFVTNKPCNHEDEKDGIASTCNYYIGRDKIKGYQCWGFASLLSDKIFGKAKYRMHKDFNKAKVGDHVRYKKHSVIILEKYKKYVIVAECNYGGTCAIKWGRKIKKSELKKAVYYTRY